MNKLLALPLTVLALIVASLALSAGPANAFPGGDCSIVMSKQLTVNAPFERFRARLGSNCVESDVEWADWDIRHSYHGPVSSYFFDGSQVESWDFYDDYDYLGTHYIEPTSAYDYDSNELTQNTLTVRVRLGSRLYASATRAGKYVTLRSTAMRYSPAADRFVRWAAAGYVAFDYRTCSTCAWKYLKAGKTKKDGRASVRVYAPNARYYRARTADTSKVWGHHSSSVRR